MTRDSHLLYVLPPRVSYCAIVRFTKLFLRRPHVRSLPGHTTVRFIVAADPAFS